jgi:hypothetical protein
VDGRALLAVASSTGAVVDVQMNDTSLADIRTTMGVPGLAVIILSDVGTWPFLDHDAQIVPKGLYRARMFDAGRISLRPLQLPAASASVGAVFMARRSTNQTNISSNVDLVFDTVTINSSSLAYSTSNGQLTLTPGTWEIEASLFANQFSDTVNGLLVYNIVNTENTVIAGITSGVSRVMNGTQNEQSSNSAHGFITVAAGQTQVIKVRALTVVGTCSFWEGSSRFIAK